MARYAISDIHGCLDTFKTLLEKIGFGKSDTLYLLGDLIDRGPESKGTMDLVMQMQKDGFGIICLKGNHEWMFSQAIDETKPYVWDWHRYASWIKNGGLTTMMNFGYQRIDDLKQIDDKYPEFLAEMKDYVELDDYFLVHAGFNFLAEDPFKDTQQMYWIRNWYKDIDPEKIHHKLILHGHSPRDYRELEKEAANPPYFALNIDCGCVYDPRTGIGKLCAYNLDTHGLVFQENIDKKKD